MDTQSSHAVKQGWKLESDDSASNPENAACFCESCAWKTEKIFKPFIWAFIYLFCFPPVALVSMPADLSLPVLWAARLLFCNTQILWRQHSDLVSSRGHLKGVDMDSGNIDPPPIFTKRTSFQPHCYCQYSFQPPHLLLCRQPREFLKEDIVPQVCLLQTSPINVSFLLQGTPALPKLQSLS